MSRAERNEAIYRENEAKPVKGTRREGRILGMIGNILMVLVMFACLSLVIPKIAGYDAYVVVSGSMEPNIPVGSIVFAKECDPATLSTGDVIVFVDPSRSQTPITHRVVTNNTKKATLTTKGDANESEDKNPILYENVKGKVDAHIPRIGFVAATLTSALGKLVAVLMLAESWLLIEIGRRKKAQQKN